MLTKGGVGQELTPLEIFGLAVASLCHDINHEGVNNAFLINAGTSSVCPVLLALVWVIDCSAARVLPQVTSLRWCTTIDQCSKICTRHILFECCKKSSAISWRMSRSQRYGLLCNAPAWVNGMHANAALPIVHSTKRSERSWSMRSWPLIWLTIIT